MTVPHGKTDDAKLKELARDIDRLVAARPDFVGIVALRFEGGRLVGWATKNEAGEELD